VDLNGQRVNIKRSAAFEAGLSEPEIESTAAGEQAQESAFLAHTVPDCLSLRDYLASDDTVAGQACPEPVGCNSREERVSQQAAA
jgi:hypothetical protein